MISFTVHGDPATQGSMKAVVSSSTGRAIVKPSKNLAPWRGLVAWAARSAHSGDPLEGPVVLRADFFVRRPKSLPKRVLHATKKPDVDKLLRALCDSLTGIVWRDDSQVVEVVATKSYGASPRVEVQVVRAPTPGRELLPVAAISAERTFKARVAQAMAAKIDEEFMVEATPAQEARS